MFIFTKNLITVLAANHVESLEIVHHGKVIGSSVPKGLKDVNISTIYYFFNMKLFSGSSNDALKIFNEIKQAIKNNDQIYEIDYKSLENEEF